ncbi:gp052 [Rhodococcus phage ReqiPepy6]|uniref:Gp052 n=1 Tax=Rhodococcus phage ReqiPepy6 TaxID=691965 RepID=D4P7G3_9CAUD|nr:gp052 [Rhodococcus phage ReqiPepy6]ADD80943.1 gp052 [Rhodococcus phage ReqiPepy6]
MRKATFVLSALSFVTSVATLGVLAYGAKKVHNDIQGIREKVNTSIGQFKKTLVNFDFSV